MSTITHFRMNDGGQAWRYNMTIQHAWSQKDKELLEERLTREAPICIQAAGCGHESRGKVLPVHQI